MYFLNCWLSLPAMFMSKYGNTKHTKPLTTVCIFLCFTSRLYKTVCSTLTLGGPIIIPFQYVNDISSSSFKPQLTNPSPPFCPSSSSSKSRKFRGTITVQKFTIKIITTFKNSCKNRLYKRTYWKNSVWNIKAQLLKENVKNQDWFCKNNHNLLTLATSRHLAFRFGFARFVRWAGISEDSPNMKQSNLHLSPLI